MQMSYIDLRECVMQVVWHVSHLSRTFCQGTPDDITTWHQLYFSQPNSQQVVPRFAQQRVSDLPSTPSILLKKSSHSIDSTPIKFFSKIFYKPSRLRKARKSKALDGDPRCANYTSLWCSDAFVLAMKCLVHLEVKDAEN